MRIPAVRHIVTRLLACGAGLLIVPSWGYAQGAIQASMTGVVSDASGAVLPGVTVEVSSQALIEKVRSAVTDGAGQYRIIGLSPGIYDATFTLSGFTAVRRVGITLSGSFTASVNAELRVATLAETITVTGESPIVNVQSARREQVLNRDVLTSVPSAGMYHSVANLVPGINVQGAQDVGGTGGADVRFFSFHGGRANEGRLLVDGVGIGANSGGTSNYVADVGNAEEVVISTSGNMGEAEVGGPIINIVPRAGGNIFSGSAFATGANSGMAGDNTKDLVASGVLRAPNELIKIWDLNGALGGPVRRDRVWFYVTSRYHGNRSYITNMWFNRNAGDPGSWIYEPDLSRRAIDDGTWKNTSLRMTWQVSPRNKVNFFWDEQRKCDQCIGGGSATVAPEAATGTNIIVGGDYWRVYQAVWTSPLTSRLLVESGFGMPNSLYGRARDGANLDLVRVVEQGGSIPGLTYRSMEWQRNKSFIPRWRGSVSYTTGAHSMKVGFDGQYFLQQRNYKYNTQGLAYRFNNGVPNQVTLLVNDFLFRNRTSSGAVYAQDQWTLGRLTMQGGLRFDYASSRYPEQVVGPLPFIPDQITFPAEDGVKGYRDISPRVGAAYDLFGDGRTSVKVNLGRYLEPAQGAGIYTDPNPVNRIGGGVPPSTARSWTDANANYVPDCDLLDPAAQDRRAAGGDFCGAWANQSFGRVGQPTTTYDPGVLAGGWGERPYDWGFGASIQREIISRLSVEAGYHRRWFGNFLATDNLLVEPTDFQRYSVIAPVDDRLPGGGGFVIGDQWNVSNDKFGLTRNFVTTARTFGERTQYWHGVDVNVNARLRSGLTIQGGTSTGRQVTDECEVIIDNPGRRNCHVALPFQTQLRGLAAYTIPKIDLLLSGTFQSNPGAQVAANRVFSSAEVAPTLGRPLAGGAANVTINLLEPGQMYLDRINQVDLRVAKVFRFGRIRANAALDLFNALNAGTVLAVNQTYGAAWLTPTGILGARFAKVSTRIEF
jgi:hypothetical protein